MATPSDIFGDAAALVALVTGAASGIGAATVAGLVGEGIGGLVLLDREAEPLRQLVGTLPFPADRVLCALQDVAGEAAWQATVAATLERFGRLDLAVANAGIAGGGAIADYPLTDWRRIMATNLDGVFLTLQHSLRLIQRGARGGAIVVVASAAALKAEVGTAAYGASKAAALHLARVAAKEGAPAGIRVNAVLPGGVVTPIWRAVPFFQDLVAQTGSEAAAFEAMAKMATPLGRYAQPEEIAAQIIWLLSDQTAAMTGAALTIDGGYTI